MSENSQNEANKDQIKEEKLQNRITQTEQKISAKELGKGPNNIPIDRIQNQTSKDEQISPPKSPKEALDAYEKRIDEERRRNIAEVLHAYDQSPPQTRLLDKVRNIGKTLSSFFARSSKSPTPRSPQKKDKGGHGIG